MGNQSDLDEAQDRLKSGTRLTRWGGWVGRLCVRQSEVNGTMHASVSYYLYSFAYH